MTTDNASKTSVLAGLLLGLLVVGWSFVMGLTGWYLDPARLYLFSVAVAIQAVVLVATLARLRRSRGYGAQLGVGLTTSAVAAVLVFVGALFLTGVLFPRYFDELREAQRNTLIAEGMNETEVEETLERAAPSRTPGSQAFAGFMGTLGTGFIISLIAAAFLHDRPVDEKTT